MTIIDTNIICRYLVKDNVSQYNQAKKILLNHEIYLDAVIIAETVWILTKFYHIPKSEVVEKLISLTDLPNVLQPQKAVIIHALTLFNDHKLAFIDCWLVALHLATNTKIITFDQELAKIAAQHDDASTA